MNGKTSFIISGEKAHSLFDTTLLQELEYFNGAVKRNHQFLIVLQKMMCYHYRLLVDNVHAIC